MRPSAETCGLSCFPAGNAAIGRTARVEERDGRLVAVADTVVTDDDVLALVDAGRR